MLVCMSATSNVTGIITDVVAVSKIAHKHGAMVVFDYAAGGKRKKTVGKMPFWFLRNTRQKKNKPSK